jgi:hypothetical protein
MNNHFKKTCDDFDWLDPALHNEGSKGGRRLAIRQISLPA